MTSMTPIANHLRGRSWSVGSTEVGVCGLEYVDGSVVHFVFVDQNARLGEELTSDDARWLAAALANAANACDQADGRS